MPFIPTRQTNLLSKLSQTAFVSGSQRAQKSSEQSLDEHRAIGEALLKAKPLVRRGYLKWAKEKFGFSKQWCARLTKLAVSWDDCLTARSWAEEQGQLPGNEFSVDGALALIRRWKVETSEPRSIADKPKQQTPSELRGGGVGGGRVPNSQRLLPRLTRLRTQGARPGVAGVQPEGEFISGVVGPEAQVSMSKQFGMAEIQGMPLNVKPEDATEQKLDPVSEMPQSVSPDHLMKGPSPELAPEAT